MSRETPSNTTTRQAATLVIFGLATALLAVEIIMRLWGYGHYERRFGTTIVANPKIIRTKTSHYNAWQNLPNLSEVKRFGDGEQWFEVPKPRGQKRLFCVGDSGMAGVGVRPDQAIPGRLGKMLAAARGKDRPLVYNLGFSGMSTVNEYEFLANKAIKFEPDIVLLGIFMANDLNFNLAHGEGSEKRSILYRAIEWLREKLALANFTVLRVAAISSRYGLFKASDSTLSENFPDELRVIDEDGMNMTNYVQGEFATYRKRYSPTMERALHTLDTLFYKFKELSRKQSFELYVVLIPTLSSIKDELDVTLVRAMYTTMPYKQALAENRITDKELADTDFGKPTRRVLELCDRRGITCINPLPVIKSTLGPKALIPNDDHLSVAGNDLVAREVFKAVFSGHIGPEGSTRRQNESARKNLKAPSHQSRRLNADSIYK